MKNNIVVFLATYQRYDSTLPLCLMSILNQSLKPDRVMLVDDNIEKRFYEHKILRNLIYLFKKKGIEFDIYHGPGKGLTHAFEVGMEKVKKGWVLKIDDDNVLEYDALEIFEKNINEKVGAMSGIILDKKTSKFSDSNIEEKLVSEDGFCNKIEDIYSVLNIQMLPIQSAVTKKVEHLYSNYFFRRDLIDDEMIDSVKKLTPSCYREDTIMTHQIFRKGYELLVIPAVKIHHLNSEENLGDRYWGKEHSDKNEDYFVEKLMEWGVVPEKMKIMEDDEKKYVIKNGQMYLVRKKQ